VILKYAQSQTFEKSVLCYCRMTTAFEKMAGPKIGKESQVITGCEEEV
jgi:hypothetical protein